MQNINFSPVMYRTFKRGEVSYRYEDTCSMDDIIKMMVAAARKLSPEALAVCLIDADQKPMYIQYIRQGFRDVRMSDIFMLATSLDMSGISVIHRYPEKIAVPPSADMSLCRAIADVSHLLGMTFYGYVLANGEDIPSGSSDDIYAIY